MPLAPLTAVTVMAVLAGKQKGALHGLAGQAAAGTNWICRPLITLEPFIDVPVPSTTVKVVASTVVLETLLLKVNLILAFRITLVLPSGGDFVLM